MKKLLLLSLAAISAIASAQTGTYYFTERIYGAIGHTWYAQSNTINGNWWWAGPSQMPIYVNNNVMQAFGFGSGGPGNEYTPTGTPTGTLSNLSASGLFHDGTWDGTNAYTVEVNTGTVYQCNPLFTSMTAIFNATANESGITYDWSDNTMWTSDELNGTVKHWSMTGSLLGGFSVSGATALRSLAYDYSDDTLWMYNASFNRFMQFTKTGTFLTGFTGPADCAGGEFYNHSASVPEPMSMIALGGGLAALLRRRRKANV